ncbi:ABC transporter ATP-binding protein [Mesorhizobium sp. M1328]
MTETLLCASNIAIEIAGLELVSNMDLEVDKGHSLGIVGETGSGKTLTCRALAGLLSPIGGRISRGKLWLGSQEATSPEAYGKKDLYGRVVSLVPQNSLTTLNPLMRIGSHLTEIIIALDADSAVRPKARAIDLLQRVGLPDPECILRQYPHELSGGMRQRVMIALAIPGRPQLLVADEPTTALDVSVQKDILELLRRCSQEENMALILVSHDLGVIAAATQFVAVMYAGMIVERGPTETVLRQPRHPYTQALRPVPRSVVPSDSLAYLGPQQVLKHGRMGAASHRAVHTWTADAVPKFPHSKRLVTRSLWLVTVRTSC